MEMSLLGLMSWLTAMVVMYEGILYNPLLLVVVAVVLIVGIGGVSTYDWLTTPKSIPALDYAKINAIERELRLPQSDYTEFGVEPVDVVEETIVTNESVLNAIDNTLHGNEWAYQRRTLEETLRSLYRVPQHHIQPMDEPYPVEVVTPSQCPRCSHPEYLHPLVSCGHDPHPIIP